jgi:hypothetical protein
MRKNKATRRRFVATTAASTACQYPYISGANAIRQTARDLGPLAIRSEFHVAMAAARTDPMTSDLRTVLARCHTSAQFPAL